MTLTSPEPPAVRGGRRDAAPDVPLLLSRLPAPARRFSLAAWERRRPLAAFVGAVALVAAVVSLLLPSWYTAESTILPPAEGSDNFGLMSALIENTALSRLGLFSATTPSDIYVEILESRTLRESLVNRFDLQSLYRQRGMDRTLLELQRHIHASTDPIGVVTLRIEDRDPQRAADMVNHMVADLDRFNRESVNTRAKRTRQFLETRLTEVRTRLEQAESTLTAYERRHKIVASSEGPAVAAMAQVISERMSLEVRRSYLESFSRAGSASLRQIEAEIGAMDREISKLPGLKQEGSRLALDAEIQRRVFTLLTAQYEDMRVQEMRDTPTITVLDAARPPEIRSWPRRSLIVAVATLAALALGLAWVGLTLRPVARA